MKQLVHNLWNIRRYIVQVAIVCTLIILGFWLYLGHSIEMAAVVAVVPMLGITLISNYMNPM